MQFSLNLTAVNHAAKCDFLREDYDNVLVCRKLDADGGLTLRVGFEATNQSALRGSLANAVISLVGELDACGIRRDCLPEAAVAVVLGGALSRPTILLRPESGKPFVVGCNILDDAGAIFEAAANVARDSTKRAVDEKESV